MKGPLLAAALALAATGGLVAAPPARAQAPVSANCGTTTATGDTCTDQDMVVQAMVTSACQYIEVGDLDFGNHRAVTADTTYTASTQVDVACNAGQNYAISFDFGQNAAGAGLRRVSDNNGHYMNYTLKTPTGAAWGDGTAGTSTYPGTGTSQNQSVPVSGSLTQTPTAPSGDYTDLVTAILTVQ